MKKCYSLATLVVAGLLSLVVSSCLNDDNEPTTKIDASYYNKVSGNYSGFVQYQIDWNSRETKKLDGIEMTVTPDSTLMIMGIPAAVFAKNITDKDIREAISALPSPTLVARYLIAGINTSGASMFVQPKSVEFKGVQVGGKSHDYSITFYVPSVALATPNYSLFSVNAYLYKLNEDGKEKEVFLKQNSVIDESLIIFVECGRARIPQ
ncbi:MAG: DUF4840 domain-containing protein [Prevotella sp.]|uniref:DUF4840 domain-containing protein n=1 Tax=Prevotella sp. TaxID=59823 RepID=UPI002A355CB5|nr:DUF4840 domain-containing protein [Prevotella sp.]MDD7317929.1 DUF4840 domain-containing protein [Prevotellaceae bacterium]MDY4020820.1 DUF4840 domain-containing protein [Prevotella sp.]